MKVSANTADMVSQSKGSGIRVDFTQKISEEEALELKVQITNQSNEILLSSLSIQIKIGADNSFQTDYEEFQNFLSDIGYDGKPIAELSQEEASELVGEDGFFGIDQTAKRIADFVINGAGGDESLMRAGREGMLRGFQEAQQIWGGELPEISQKTMQQALEIVDKAMHDLGFSIIDEEV